ncbi:MAG: ATP-binding protein [Gemmatimonas sp.]|nr:ATP-binding protein [Gemmatimonas sp.]
MTDESDTTGTERSLDSSAEVALQLPSDLRIIEAAVSHLVSRCRAFAFEGPRLELNFRVGVTEALANAVLYGNSNDPAKTVYVKLKIDEHQVVVCVADEGDGFDPSSVPDPTTPENIHSPGGRGLFLIQHLMDEIHFNERGNSVRMVLMREEPRRPRG